MYDYSRDNYLHILKYVKRGRKQMIRRNFWLLVGSQTLYGDDVLRTVDNRAKEMVQYSNINILEQVGQAMMAQANQTSQGVLTLLS